MLLRPEPCRVGAALLALLLIATPRAASQLDPKNCAAARKEMAQVMKSAAFEHRVELFDAVVAFSFSIAFPLAHAQAGDFNADSLETLRNALDGLARDMQESALGAGEMVAAQVPQVLMGAFGGPLPSAGLPPGFLPGDGGMLDGFREKLARQQATIVKGLAKVAKKVAAMLHKSADVELNWVFVPPEIPWVAGSDDCGLTGVPCRQPLDVLLTARGMPVGVRALAAGWADEAQGDVLVEILGPDNQVTDSQLVTPQDGRWSATFVDVDVNPVIVRVSHSGLMLAQRVIGIR